MAFEALVCLPASALEFESPSELAAAEPVPELLSESPLVPEPLPCDEPAWDLLESEWSDWAPACADPEWACDELELECDELDPELDESDDGLALATAAPLSKAAPTPNVVAPAVSQVETIIGRCCLRCCARAIVLLLR